MALLTLVRHGQASFMADNYDKLSPLGELQAAKLGEYWIRTQTVFDQVYFGPAERHIRTGEIAGEVCRRGGLPFVEPIPLPEVDEYSGIEVIRAFLPGLLEKHDDIREMEARYRSAADQTSAARIYDRLFQRITRMWVAGELDSAEVESWARFCERVDRGISRIRERPISGGKAVVFTSGGVIAAVSRSALDLSPERTLELSWASKNGSYTEFLFSAERFSLSSFNNIPHLSDPALITYR